MVMQSVNGAQYLNIPFLLVLFATAPTVAVFGSVIVPLASYMHHYNHINLTLSWTF